MEYLDRQYQQRRQEFDKNPMQTDRYSEFTENINKVASDYHKVSKTKHATQDEQATILKSIMATTLIHGNSTHYTLRHPQLAKEDRLYRHFKIISHTEKLSHQLMEYINNASVVVDKKTSEDMLSSYLKSIWGDYTELDTYGHITREMFSLWFNKTRDEHKQGFSIRQATLMNDKVTPVINNRISPVSITEVPDQHVCFTHTAELVEVLVDENMTKNNSSSLKSPIISLASECSPATPLLHTGTCTPLLREFNLFNDSDDSLAELLERLSVIQENAEKEKNADTDADFDADNNMAQSLFWLWEEFAKEGELDLEANDERAITTPIHSEDSVYLADSTAEQNVARNAHSDQNTRNRTDSDYEDVKEDESNSYHIISDGNYHDDKEDGWDVIPDSPCKKTRTSINASVNNGVTASVNNGVLSWFKRKAPDLTHLANFS